MHPRTLIRRLTMRVSSPEPQPLHVDRAPRMTLVVVVLREKGWCRRNSAGSLFNSPDFVGNGVSPTWGTPHPRTRRYPAHGPVVFEYNRKCEDIACGGQGLNKLLGRGVQEREGNDAGSRAVRWPATSAEPWAVVRQCSSVKHQPPWTKMLQTVESPSTTTSEALNAITCFPAAVGD